MNGECLRIFREIAVKQKDDDSYLKILSRILEYEGDYAGMPRDAIEPLPTTEKSTWLADGNFPDEGFQDLRLKQLTFRYFRTFPVNENEKPYGVLFEKKGKPCSTFLVGRNSTGKSTIFDAIEYYYAHRVSNAELKAIPKEKEHEYLTYGFGKIKSPQAITAEDVRLSVRTTAGSGTYRLNELQPVCLPALFCSDYDLLRIGLLDEKELEDFVFKQLGYSDLLKILSSLKKIVEEIKDTIKNLQESEKQVQLEPQDVEKVTQVFEEYYDTNRDEAIALCKNYVGQKEKAAVLIQKELESPRKENIETPALFPKEWTALLANASRTDRNASGSDMLIGQVQKLGLMYELLHEALVCDNSTKALQLLAQRQKEAREWIEKLVLSTQKKRKEQIEKDETLLPVLRQITTDLDNALRDIVNSFVAQYGSFIERSLSYFSPDKETFKLHRDIQGGIKVVIHIADKEGDFDSTPAWYLNSFRFRLYAIALKLSLAFWYMQKNKRILPIAIDDVFNANDFENSMHLQQFVHSIYEVYHDTVCQSIPLQMILLTHDEIILSAFHKGHNVQEIKEWGASEAVREKTRRKYELYKNNCIVGRLYPYEEAQYICSFPENTDPNIYNLYNVLNGHDKK